MIGARELSPIARAAAAVLAPGTPTAPVPSVIPVILRATAAESVGACMRVGGRRVVDRAIRQLARLRDARVIVVTDDSITLPHRLPPNIERREIAGDVDVALARLRAELGPETTSVGADTVWLQPGRFENGIRVIDRASRRAAADSVYADLQREADGIFDRLINRRLSTALTRLLFAKLPLTPALVTLLAGFVGVYGALLVAAGTAPTVVIGFAALQGYVVLEGCASVLARLRLHQSALGAWLAAMTADFVSIVLILAVGRALWGHGGSFLDMEIAAAGAAMTLFSAIVSYRELLRQGESDVSKLRWWFAHGQSLRTLSGAGSRPIKAVTMLGRRDVLIAISLVLACFDQLPIVLLLLLIVAISRAGAALVQLLTPGWRLRPLM
ncbi:MAG TPA: hypothetical protein VN903_01670 [Polyangia bacterium]|jgi:hypothetical protein|nr:hypothetical protein [Polyangia bacterium]